MVLIAREARAKTPSSSPPGAGPDRGYYGSPAGARAGKIKHIIIVVVAVANISTASIFVRLAGVHGFVAASWRLILSSAATLAYLAFLGRGELAYRAWMAPYILLSGAALALHFGLWMMSLSHLTVAASVTIVDSYPALMVVLGRLMGERYTPLQVRGALTAMAGVAGLALYSSGLRIAPPGGDPALGAVLALAGMVCVAVYFAVGKMLRRHLSTAAYTGPVYAVAALVASAITLLLGHSLTGYPARAYLYLAGLAVFPMLGGHTLINYAMKRLSLLAATVPVLGEPVGAAVLAWIVLGERLDPGTVVWMAVTVLGIGLVLAEEARSG